MPLLVACALAWSGAGDAQSADPQALVDAQRAQVRGMIRPGCRASDDPEDITVCGRRDDRGPRGPLPAIPFEPLPGTIPPGARAGNFVDVKLNDGGEVQVQARHVIIATGSIPIELPFLKFDEKRILSNTGALIIPEVPTHLVVIG